MSISAMSDVWQGSTTSGSHLLVLLAIADAANEEGWAWPSQVTLAQRARISERQVRRVTKDLEALGELRIELKQEGRKRKCYYRVATGRIDRRSSTSTGQIAPPRPDIAMADESSTEPSGPSSKTSSSQKDVQTVYDVWRKERKRTNARYEKITPNRRRKIEMRLKEYSVEDLITAIRGVACDPWDGRPQHDDITVIFRSAEQVDKFIALAEHGSPQGGGTVYRQLDPGEQF